MKSRILFVSTYPELTAMAGEISDKLGIPLNIHEGGIMRDGHIFAKEREKELDVIISCGATAAAIKEMVSIPVVSVETGTVDFLNALIKAREYGDRIGLVSYKNERLEDLEGLKSVLNIDFIDFPYSNKEELEARMEDALAFEKLTVVSMGNCIIEVAAKKGLKGVLINHSRRSVEQAIIAARNISHLGRREKERAERLKAVIDYSGEGIVAADKNGVITTFNPAAEKILGINAAEAVGRPAGVLGKEGCFDVFYGERRQDLGRLININNTQIILNKVPIIVDSEQVGTVFTLQEVSRIQKLEHKVRKELYTKGLVARYRFEDIIGESSVIKEAIIKAQKFGRTSTTVLIEGETGTGKELFAQSIHNISSRRKGPFVAINCAALPENLLESELFGYEEGAFTGAKKGGKPGLFELAHGGTIFLDEISQISPRLQSRLLRVIQEKEVLRIGGEYILNIDARVISATNHNLYELVQKGEFREDLFFRINVLNLKVPPLRARREDIPLLAGYLLKNANHRHNTHITDITDGGMELLKRYNWPGNVRELESFAEKMVILAEQPVIDQYFVRQLLSAHAVYKDTGTGKNADRDDVIEVSVGSLRDMELQLIETISSRYRGDKQLISGKLGISRTTLWKKLKELEAEDQ
ncbi:MAG: sigma 54-interacting transcriptional regulator [Bacillota bacterium]|nr:sigma 54-interacting transcriptional regulator [Bacillota bacterium]MDD3298296.1 sigma 54-interacting transcriptional regulator [Bacillota bacterium]MDD3850330.1 sigma 54-interacting transcriptional regulator [Bacillota bacterium]MDD4707002.1 sigma 54-interacting transcriptional regulator [Bacillota bacterium]